MTRKHAKELLPILQAYADGKTIQTILPNGKWIDCEKPDFNCNISFYRIKPEENYTIEQNCGENRVEGGVLSVSGSVSEKHTCKECVGKIVSNITGGKLYCKNKNCDLPAYDSFKPKKEKHFRPFNNCDELVETYHNRAFIPTVAEGLNQKLKRMYRPEIWVKEKETGIEQLITGFGDSVVKFSPDYTITLKSLFENYEFLDSSQCGCLEE